MVCSQIKECVSKYEQAHQMKVLLDSNEGHLQKVFKYKKEMHAHL